MGGGRLSRWATIATGSHDKTVCVWSLSLRSLLPHDYMVVGVKFSSPLPLGASGPFGSMTASAATSSSPSRFKSPRRLIIPWPGRVIASLSRLTTATSAVSTCPPGRRALSGPSATGVGPRRASSWRAMAHSSQPPFSHLSRSGTPRRTSKSVLSSSMQRSSSQWLSQQTTTLR